MGFMEKKNYRNSIKNRVENKASPCQKPIQKRTVPYINNATKGLCPIELNFLPDTPG